jgi:hypothetical protein
MSSLFVPKQCPEADESVEEVRVLGVLGVGHDPAQEVRKGWWEVMVGFSEEEQNLLR